MPFTPKFVDMVRNLTTSTGTGAVNPGSAVSGFTSLSAAIATGEQFYYCIQGVDKPAEREVGRGTMQVNGSIAREAISGGLTNFTAGTKTIALVTAAEWFAKVEQGGAGGSSSLTVPGLTELAALPTANGATTLLTAKGREGLFVFSVANLSALVTADTRQGIYVAPAAAATGASGAWVRKYDGAISLAWFLTTARIPFVTDDLPAVDGALALLKAQMTAKLGVEKLAIPAGRYYCSDTINVHVPVNIEGAGGNSDTGTIIRFPKNKNGIVFNHMNTHGDGTGSQGSSTGGGLRGVQLFGPVTVDGAGNVTVYGDATATTGHGVRIRTTFIELDDVYAALFGGDGFNLFCFAGSGGVAEGNANSFRMVRCQSNYNRRFGYLIQGTDANAGTIDTCSAIDNGGGGFIDYSFLGNTYIQCHVRDCGTNGAGPRPVGVCTYGGLGYYVIVGQEAAASTTIPGTNAAVWALMPGGGASVPWVTGMTWVNPSPYGTNPANVNGRNVFLGCYAEGSQAPCQATTPTLFVGGLIDEVGGVVGNATWQRGSTGGGIIAGEFQTIQGNFTTTFGQSGGTILRQEEGGSASTSFDLMRVTSLGGKAIIGRIANSGEFFNIGLDAAHTRGANSFSIGNLWVGAETVSSAVRLGLVLDPTGMTGPVPQGSMFLKANAVVGGPAGYVCTTASVAGAGALFAAMAPLGLAEASNAELWTGTTANRFVSPKRLFEASAEVTLTDGATITPTFAAGLNFRVTLGGNRTLANPTNAKPGQSGVILVTQDGTGTRTLAYGSNWRLPGGSATNPLSTAAGSIDLISFFVRNDGTIAATLAKALAA